MGAFLAKLFVVVKGIEVAIEWYLAKRNRRVYLDQSAQALAKSQLEINEEDFAKTLAYTEDRYRFVQFSRWFRFIVLAAAVLWGGFRLIEVLAAKITLALDANQLVLGLIFFGLLGLVLFAINLPFELYSTFVIEERHGFNRQTVKGFVADRVKGVLIGVILGGAILALIMWILRSTGDWWWVYAWVAVSGFSVLTTWLYPTLLAPLFNKFRPLEEGALRDGIFGLAKRVDFPTADVYVMDASVRFDSWQCLFYWTVWGQAHRPF